MVTLTLSPSEPVPTTLKYGHKRQPVTFKVGLNQIASLRSLLMESIERYDECGHVPTEWAMQLV